MFVHPTKMLIGPDGQLVKAEMHWRVKPGWHLATPEEIAAKQAAAKEADSVVEIEADEVEVTEDADELESFESDD